MTWTIDEVRAYTYSGAVKSETLDPGTYKLECWGAQGRYGRTAAPCELGGYVVGELTVTETKEISIFVGGAGGFPTAGWNGGGRGGLSGYSGGGGGASDIRLGGTELTNRIIVAGGSGGGGFSTGGGYGGGLIGGDSPSPGGTGGSQVAGGVYDGELGIGGSGTLNYTGGGGGGYYGGGRPSSTHRGAGGGSSYYGTLTNASTTANVKSGHGEIIITMISGDGPTPTTPKRRYAQII